MDKKPSLTSTNRQFHLEHVVPESQSHHWLALLLRLGIGFFFIMSSINIIIDYSGFINNLGSILVQGFWIDQDTQTVLSILPVWMIKAIGYSLPWILLVFGILLLTGFLTRLSSIILMLVMIPIIYQSGVIHGDFSTNFISYGEYLIPNVVKINRDILIIFCLIGLAISGSGKYSLDAMFNREEDI